MERVASKGYYYEQSQIENDSDLISLRHDKRWQPLLDVYKANREKAEAKLNKLVARKLDSIFIEDQKYRQMLDSVETTFGNESKEVRMLWRTIEEKDSVNLMKVKVILETYGWLGTDEAGQHGNTALFLVIQHADLQTQEKYLPVMKEAVNNGKASPADLALLVDRIEMRNGRPQIYGSQITIKNGKHKVYDIIDERNVNKRRAEVGLEPLEDYVTRWGIEYRLPK